MSLTTTIAGFNVTVLENSFKLSDKVDERSRCSFTVLDATGTLALQKGQPVSVVDSVLGTLFTGYVNQPNASKLYPNAARLWSVDCVDQTYLLDKRASNKIYSNQFAGTIVADQLQRYGAAENVTGAFALRWDELETDWAAGTLTNTVATANATDGNLGDGDLELALAGSTVTFQQVTQADFNAGTTGGGLSSPATGGVTFTSTPAIKYEAMQALPGISNANIYTKIWDHSVGSYTIPTTFPTLFYDIWIADSSPQQMAGIEVVCTDGTSFIANVSQWNNDAQGLSGAPTNDLSGLATNQWYSRALPLYGLSTLGGKSVQYVAVVLAGSNQGTYTTYFRNVKIAQNDGVTNELAIFTNTATAIAITPQQLQDNGYTTMSCIFVTSYERHGFMFSPAFNLASAAIARSSYISWDVALPNNKFTFTITASVNGFATFLPCTLNGPIPGLLPGASLAGKNLFLVYVFDNSSNDPTLTPVLSRVAGNVQPSYACTKSDIINTTNTQAGWQAGTLTNLTAPGGSVLQLNGCARNWDDANFSSQTQFGSTSPSQGVRNKQFFQTLGSGSDCRSRLDFAGSNWQNFTAEVDVICPPNANTQIGFVYRTTGWQAANDTYAYAVVISTDGIHLGKGTNSSSGAGSFTSIDNTSGLTLTAGQIYHLKIIINGNTHQIFLNDVLYINTTDATYPAAGYLGLRCWNNTGSSYTGIYDNFGVVAALSGTWVSPALDIHSLGSISNSQLLLQIDPAVNTSVVTFLAEISLNDGTTWATCPNNLSAPVVNGEGFFQSLSVPGLATGTNVSAMTQVLLRLTISASTASVGASDSGQFLADLSAVSLFLIGAYNSTGTRVSPALSLSPVGRVSTALVNWNATLPTGTSLAVVTSIDGGATYQPIANPGDYIPTISNAAFYAAVRASSPLAFYRLNEQSGIVAYDSSNAGHTGTLNGTVTPAQTGMLAGLNESGDTAMLFDGQTGYISLPTSFVPTGAHPWSLECLCKITAIPASGNYGIVAMGQNANQQSGQIKLHSDGTNAQFVLGTFNGLITGSNIAVDTIYHLVGTYDGTNIRLYQNGLLVAGPTPFTLNLVATYVLIGADGSPASEFFAGTIQCAGFYGVALTQSDITAHYNAAITATQSSYTDTFTSNDSASYMQSNFGGGVTGTWTWDTANSRLVGNAGTSGTLVNSTALTAADNQVMADFDQADGSGLIANYVNSNNLYFVQIWDSSGTGTQNSVKLFKRSSGVSTQLGSTVAISFPRGSYRRFILDVQAGVITVSMDGIQLIQQTDGSPLGSGEAGLLLNTLVRCYSLRIQQYGQNISTLSLLTKLTLTSTDPTVTPRVLDLQALVSSPALGPGVLIPSSKYQNTFVSANIDDLNKQSDYWWYVNSDKSVVFQPRDAIPAPWVLSSANSQSIAGQQIGDVLVQNLNVQYSGDLYRNQQVMAGAIDTALFIEIKAGDGTTRTWNVANPLFAPPAITLNGQVVSVGIKGVDTGKQYYYQLGSTSISQDSSQALLEEDDVLSIIYTGSFSVDVTVNNTGGFPGTVSQSQMAAIDGSSGIVTAIQDVSSTPTTKAAATTQANQLLQRYGILSGRTLTFRTLHGGLQPGQQLTAFVPEENVIDIQFLVAQVDTTITTLTGGVLQYWYDVTACEGPVLGSWVRLFASGLGG